MEERKRVLVTGCSGMTGRALMRALPEKFDVVGQALSRATGEMLKLDLLDGKAVAKAFAEIKPAAVVHCAAERRPDVSEKDKDFTTALNVGATEMLAKLCQDSGAFLVVLSTDYVFDGTTPPYKPDDAPHPLQFYGESKLKGEEAALKACPGGVAILRVPVLYARDLESLEESATTVIAKKVLAGKEAKEDDYSKRYPTLTDDVAACIAAMLQHQLGGVGGLGGKKFHCANNEVQYTKFTIAQVIGEVMGVETGHITSDPNPPAGAPRPRDTKLDVGELEGLGLLPTFTPLKVGLKDALTPFKPS